VQQRASAGRGRPRSPETDRRIVAATLELIREQGPEAVNVATVAARSGIARTTIYRRYRDRRELLDAALQPATSRGEPPAAASIRDKIGWVLTQTQAVLAGSIGPGGVAAVITDSDPDFSAALRASLHAALEPVRRQVADDVAQGRLAPGMDPDLVLNLILGAYLAELVRYGVPRSDWLPRTADLLAASLTPRAT
jgi:AcrR family transcriptional regulator